MENIEQILPTTEEDYKKVLKSKKNKQAIKGVIITIPILLLTGLFIIYKMDDIAVTIMVSAFFIFLIFFLLLMLYITIITPIQKGKATGKKRQLIGIVTEKYENRNRYGKNKQRKDNTVTYYIRLGEKEKIELLYYDYIKVKLNQKIKIETFLNSKTVISIEVLSENDSSIDYSDSNFVENIDNSSENSKLSKNEIKYLKKKSIRVIIGLVMFYSFLGFIFYFILKVMVVAIIYKIFPSIVKVIEASAVRYIIWDTIPLIILTSIILLSFYLRLNKKIKDINTKKKRIVNAKIDDKIKSEVKYYQFNNPEIKKLVNTIRIYSLYYIFNVEVWIRLAQNMFKAFTYNKPKVNATPSYYYYYYIVINKIYFIVSEKDYNKFEINEKVKVHFANYSNLPVLIQSNDDKNKTIDISIKYEKKEKTS